MLCWEKIWLFEFECLLLNTKNVFFDFKFTSINYFFFFFNQIGVAFNNEWETKMDTGQKTPETKELKIQEVTTVAKLLRLLMRLVDYKPLKSNEQ